MTVGENKRWSLGIVLLLIYLGWLATTPYHSPRLGFLATIRFERFLAAALILTTLLTGRLQNLLTTIPCLVFGFFLWMVVSALVSPFPSYQGLANWQEDYWKLIVLFVVQCLYRHRIVSTCES